MCGGQGGWGQCQPGCMDRTGASECGSADWHGNWSVDVQCTSTKQWNGEQWTDHRQRDYGGAGIGHGITCRSDITSADCKTGSQGVTWRSDSAVASKSSSGGGWSLSLVSTVLASGRFGTITAGWTFVQASSSSVVRSNEPTTGSSLVTIVGIRDNGQLGLVSHHSWIRTKPSHIEGVAIDIEPAMQECRGCSSGSCTGSNCDDGWMAASVDDNMGGDHRRTAIKQSGVDEHGSDRISECDSGGIGSEHGELWILWKSADGWEQHRVDLVDLGLIGAQQGRRDWSEYISDCGSDHERVCVEHDECNESGCTVEQQCCTVQWSLDGKHECVDCGTGADGSIRQDWGGADRWNEERRISVDI